MELVSYTTGAYPAVSAGKSNTTDLAKGYKGILKIIIY
jgi:hypothetical protein